MKLKYTEGLPGNVEIVNRRADTQNMKMDNTVIFEKELELGTHTDKVFCSCKVYI